MDIQGYRIEISQHEGNVAAVHQGNVLAESSNVLILRETRLDDYYYFPMDSFDPKILTPSAHRSFCPFKGTASYWHVDSPDGRIDNGAWAYESPLNEAAAIGGYISFTNEVADQYKFAQQPAKRADDGHVSSGLSDWILREAGYCSSRQQLVRLLGRKLVEEGIAVYRLNITIWSLHPEIAGKNYMWLRDSDEVIVSEPSHDVFENKSYLNSPMNLVTQGLGGVRQPLSVDEAEFEFPIMEDLKAQGATDYVAMPLHFSDGQFHPMTLTSDHERGFTTANLGLIFECIGVISRYFEVLTLRANTVTLLDTYLGQRTGQQILEGKIRRGEGENIRAVILFSDLRNSSELAEKLPREQYLKLLNKYFETILEPITEYGGEVLKFIGDAVLAIFPLTDNLEDQATQTKNALLAAMRSVALLHERTASDMGKNRPLIDFGIGLHIGEVTYGNVGGQNRLDFTVIGPSVNLASRIESLCKSTGHRILLSSDFKTAMESGGKTTSIPIHSIGEHKLPGIAASQTVFTVK